MAYYVLSAACCAAYRQVNVLRPLPEGGVLLAQVLVHLQEQPRASMSALLAGMHPVV